MRFADWLALREPADAAARAAGLVEHLPATDHHLIHDLGAGTGSMGRWLAPRLSGPQHWVLHDRDPELLELAHVPGSTVEKRESDITRLRPADLAGATLVTASALLDLLTAEEVHELVAACAGCPALLTLSVTGRVELTPPDALDRRVAAAFDAHQRRGALLGPDALETTAEAFRRSGHTVLVRPSPWRLGPTQADLAAAWFRGWVGAACEQEPEFADEAKAYTRRRRARPFAVVVDHADLLALPDQPPSNRGDSA